MYKSIVMWCLLISPCRGRFRIINMLINQYRGLSNREGIIIMTYQFSTRIITTEISYKRMSQYKVLSTPSITEVMTYQYKALLTISMSQDNINTCSHRRVYRRWSHIMTDQSNKVLIEMSGMDRIQLI